MPYASEPFERPHHPDHKEVVEPQKPSHDSYLRYIIGLGLGVLLIGVVPILAGQGWLAAKLFTLLSGPLAVLLTVIFVCMLFRGTLKEAGPAAIIIWTALALYGWFALIVWIGQSAWGWSVF